MGRPNLDRIRRPISWTQEALDHAERAVNAGVAEDRSAVVRELLEAWARDDRVRRAVASWRARAKKD